MAEMTEAQRAARRRYNASPKGRESRRRYAATPKGRAAQLESKRRYNTANADKIAAAGQKRFRRLIQQVNAIKVASGCTDCGYRTHPVALDFDHVTDDKRGDISDLIRSASWAVIAAEIAKCEVVCANCHRIRTLNRGPRKPAPVDDAQGMLW